MSKEKEKSSGIGGFAVFLRVIAVLTLIASVFIGDNAAKDYSGYWMVYRHSVLFTWIAYGIVSCVSMWALSVIVAACQKYLDKN